MSDNTTPSTTIVVSEAAFSTNFKLYAPDGTLIQFTCRVGATHAEHLTALAAYRAALVAEGYANELPGLEDGQKIEEVDAFVKGATSKGDAALYLYSTKHLLQYRVAAVYVERFGDLPFQVNGAKPWDAAAPPTREEAEKKGYLVPVSPFKIVMEPNGQTDDGKPRWKYAGVFGAAPAAPNGNGHAQAPAPNSHGNGNGHAPAAAPAPATPKAAAPANGAGDAPVCPKCGGSVWDNRAGKRNPDAPDYKCRNRACDGAIWPLKNGNGAAKTAAPATAPAPSGVPF